MLLLLVAISLLVTTNSSPLPSRKIDDVTCGYAACPIPKDGMLNVHLVPHSHDDVGWLRTVDQYYYGNQADGVQYIIDSVTTELLQDPNKRFIQVETAFFSKWWLEQDDNMRDKFKSLINSGQIEMTGGGWSMNDEAAVHYQSTIDQFTLGLRWLNDTFGECGRPRVGWQIDPFGHSRETASIMAQIGFDGVLFARLDYQDKDQRLKDKNMEVIWHGSANLGESADLFTSALYDFYGSPGGFCFDFGCNDDPIIDNKDSPEYNAFDKFSQFKDYVTRQSNNFNTDNILVPMGGDFNYKYAHYNYKNMDKLIKVVNAQQNNGSNVNVFYSTPSCYLKAVNDADKTWNTKSDDFFPYASDPDAFWTGYFTSRPTSKRYERYSSNFLQVCKQLSALANVGSKEYLNQVDKLREALGIMQHHDAITGTEKQAVADDYARILANGIQACENVTKISLNKLMSAESEQPLTLSLNTCHLLNISKCDVSENFANFLVTVYNPVSHPVSRYIRLPVTGDSYQVTDASGSEITSQLVPVPEFVTNIPERASKATNELVFLAENLPAFGFASFKIAASSSSTLMKESVKSDDNSIGNEVLTVVIDPESGKMKSVTNNGVELEIGQDFSYYIGALGDNSAQEKRSSGAYIFRPNGTDSINFGESVKVTVYKGDLVEEVHQVFSDWVSQVIRVYKGENHVELQWMVGPIPIDDDKGKEVITRFTTDLDTQELFYTDSNGREMIERRRDYRPTWNVTLNEVVSGNYYPVTSKILIRDESKGVEVAVLNDRAQGGSSLANGQMEVMVHRRLLHDDAFGAGEALNETQFGHGLIATGHHYLVAGNSNGNDNMTLAAQERLLAQEILLAPWIFLSPNVVVNNNIKQEFSGTTTTLPLNVHILTLELLDETSLLLRIEHILEKDEDPALSADVTVNLQDLLPSFNITAMRETTLAANQWLSDLQRLQWRSTDSSEARQTRNVADDDFNVTLSPMQIRTFILNFESV